MNTFHHRFALFIQTSSMSMATAYAILGLQEGASPEEVKAAYRAQVKKFHPDKASRGDEMGEAIRTEQMKAINEARETIETLGAGPKWTPNDQPVDEGMWEQIRRKYGPKASGRYNASDLDDFAAKVVAAGFFQIIYRTKVPWVPFGAGFAHGDTWTYYRPFGSKTRTQRMANPDASALAAVLRQYTSGHEIFDVAVKPREAWVTWEDGRDYQSISFEKPKSTPKKEPGVGMTPAAVRAYLAEKGMVRAAGGTKYTYWGATGHTSKTGVFIREGAKVIRLVKREKIDRTIEDISLANEIYFGKVSVAVLDKLIAYVKSRAG